jgi:hypothetical protein
MVGWQLGPEGQAFFLKPKGQRHDHDLASFETPTAGAGAALPLSRGSSTPTRAVAGEVPLPAEDDVISDMGTVLTVPRTATAAAGSAEASPGRIGDTTSIMPRSSSQLSLSKLDVESLGRSDSAYSTSDSEGDDPTVGLSGMSTAHLERERQLSAETEAILSAIGTSGHTHGLLGFAPQTGAVMTVGHVGAGSETNAALVGNGTPGFHFGGHATPVPSAYSGDHDVSVIKRRGSVTSNGCPAADVVRRPSTTPSSPSSVGRRGSFLLSAQELHERIQATAGGGGTGTSSTPGTPVTGAATAGSFPPALSLAAASHGSPKLMSAPPPLPPVHLSTPIAVGDAGGSDFIVVGRGGGSSSSSSAAAAAAAASANSRRSSTGSATPTLGPQASPVCGPGSGGAHPLLTHTTPDVNGHGSHALGQPQGAKGTPVAGLLFPSTPTSPSASTIDIFGGVSTTALSAVSVVDDRVPSGARSVGGGRGGGGGGGGGGGSSSKARRKRKNARRRKNRNTSAANPGSWSADMTAMADPVQPPPIEVPVLRAAGGSVALMDLFACLLSCFLARLLVVVSFVFGRSGEAMGG